MATEPEAFGTYLRRHREAAEMSLRELAKRLELSPSMLSRVENNAAAPLAGEHLEAIHEALPTVSTLQLALMRLMHLDLQATTHVVAAFENPHEADWSEQ